MAIDNEFNKIQYDRHIDEYLNTNSDQHVGGGDATSRVDLIRQYLPKGSTVFEIGAGGGDDALALRQAGFAVTASDFSDEFVKILKSKNIPALQNDAKQDELPGAYQAIYANAVFVHFEPAELDEFLLMIANKLQSPKIIFFSVIAGETQERRAGSNISFERDFQDYSETAIQKILRETGYTVLHLSLVDKRWYQVVAKYVH